MDDGKEPPSKLHQLIGIDLRALAALRIGAGVLLLTDVILRAFNLSAHYTDAGVVPRALRGVSLYGLGGSSLYAGCLFALTAGCALMLTLGYRTRLATIACFFLAESLDKANPILNTGGDRILCLILFWGIFLPLGARASLDGRFGRVDLGARARATVCSVATVALLVQVLVIYVVTGFLKDDPQWLTERSALYFALNKNGTDFGDWLMGFPVLLEWMTTGTLLLERYGPLLAFVPFGICYFRTLLAASFIGLHLGLAVFMTLGYFPYVCMVVWLVFLPTPIWDAVSRLGGPWSGRRAPERQPLPRTRQVPARLTELATRWRLPLLLRASLVVAVIFVVARSFADLPILRDAPLIGRVSSMPRFHQAWGMYSPKVAPRYAYWFVMPARLKGSGVEVDLATGGGPVLWDGYEAFWEKDARWSRYFVKLRGLSSRPEGDRKRAYVIHYADWLRRRWNSDHDPSEQIESMEIYVVYANKTPRYGDSEVFQQGLPLRVLIYEWNDGGLERVPDGQRAELY